MATVDDQARKSSIKGKGLPQLAAETHSEPVQNVEASLARKSATPRNSSGLARRPSGLCEDHVALSSGLVSRNAFVILKNRYSAVNEIDHVCIKSSTYSVSTYPGLIELTRMFLGPSSQAMERAICITAALLALYAVQCMSYSQFIRSKTWLLCSANLVGYATAHTPNQDDTARRIVFDHLPASRLGSVENAADVNVEELETAISQ